MKNTINILSQLGQSLLWYCNSLLPLHQYWLALGFSVVNMFS